MSGLLTPAQFVAKWTPVTLPERAASHEHFIDLCRMLGQPTPAEFDATGAEYTFEKGVAVTGAASAGSQGERGFADVWWRGRFAWEYKRKGKYRDLTEAYRQLCQYREALENPPLLVVSDIARTEIHTNFTGTAKQKHVIQLTELAEPRGLGLLRRVFTDPDSFRPTLTPERVTEDVAKEFAQLAQRLRDRGDDPHVAAHFLMKCMFCLFAEDVDLLPGDLFKRSLRTRRNELAALTANLTALFDRMRTGGDFGVDAVPHFNGGLFDESPALRLLPGHVHTLLRAADFDWGSVEPAVFGTLFERSLDPNTRAQIGAHYTSREDIMLIVEPVVMAPLRREWEAVKTNVEAQLARRRSAGTPRTRAAADRAIHKALQDFVHRLASIRILDPACGSGNFLYVAIQQLLNLEKEVITFAARPDISLPLLPQVRPTQLLGIEINPYAAELAQVVIWIGYLQWMRDNGFSAQRTPILEPMQTIENRDAILDFLPLPPGEGRGEGIPSPSKGEGEGEGEKRTAVPAQWPDADFIIGNPPFLGSKLFRQQGLDDAYVSALYEAYDLPKISDLCCYWFELARRAIHKRSRAQRFVSDGTDISIIDKHGKKRPLVTDPSPDPFFMPVRAGLLATQGIRGGENRAVLKRIKETGDIFMAWSDRQWVLDGAAVHVSIVGFDDGAEANRALDGVAVASVNSDLTSCLDFTEAKTLQENEGLYVRSPEKGAKFEITYGHARDLLPQPNPNGRPTSDVLRPWINGKDLVNGRPSDWILDFDQCETESKAAGYGEAFEHVRKAVLDARLKNRDPRVRENWWRFRRSGDGVRAAALRQPRLLGTTMVAKHRLFQWIDSAIQADKTIPIFARSDDYFFGVLHSSIHELWALRMGTQLEDRPRYTPTTCFETFPLPWPPGSEPTDHDAYLRISEAAKELNDQRERWLNPQEWIAPSPATSTPRMILPTCPPKPGPSSASPPSWPAPPRTPGSRNAPSPISTTSARPGSASPTTASTAPSSPPTPPSIPKATGPRIGPPSGPTPAPAGRCPTIIPSPTSAAKPTSASSPTSSASTSPGLRNPTADGLHLDAEPLDSILLGHVMAHNLSMADPLSCLERHVPIPEIGQESALFRSAVLLPRIGSHLCLGRSGHPDS